MKRVVMEVTARRRFVEFTYINSLDDKQERTCLLDLNELTAEKLKEKLAKWDKLAPNRIITNVDLLYSIKSKKSDE